MTKKMLIDAANKEEVRVCVLENSKVEDFDFESASKKPLRGNIYLARVTRVEPSLQAAFVEYGGNRHGFLAFSEIHPDYYQVPVADREAIQAAEAEEAELAAKLNLNADEDEPQRDSRSDEDDDDRDSDDEETVSDAKPRSSKRRRARGGRRQRGGNRKTEHADAVDADGVEATSEGDSAAENDISDGGAQRVDTSSDDEPDVRADDSDASDSDLTNQESAEHESTEDDVVDAQQSGGEATVAESESDQGDDVSADGENTSLADATDDEDAPENDDDPSGPALAMSTKKPPEVSEPYDGADDADGTDDVDGAAEATDVTGAAAEHDEDGHDEDDLEVDDIEGETEEVFAADDQADDADDDDNEDETIASDEISDQISDDISDEFDDDFNGDVSADDALDDDLSENDASEDDDEAGEEDESDEDEEDDSGLTSESRAALLEQYKEARRKRQRILRNYKIQEVIKRRQILLIQVVKEERGNKGAALTTYLSLAGRYCVLMPNTARGGGISRKIPSATDRKRLRKVVDSLEVPKGMGLIIRTAGAARTKAEIKRDYDYLSRLWESIRALTLKSIAPSLIYEEASLIKRAIRDLYDKDIDLVLVHGEQGYREAKDFMKMLMPSHAKNVQPYKEATPLFLRHGVETQLDAMYQPNVRLKSGGYLVINQTEALIAIDVNSGKATRERNIEQTALKTNLEAAKEVARQCRLRDLAGLLVIDFIDMEEHRNNRAVEKKLKEALKSDRARLQVGRISSFGLLEMSRQRRRSGIVDGTTNACPTCGGSGVIRSYEMAGLRILRAVEADAIAGKAGVICVRTSLDATLYILNHKRDWLKRIETSYGVAVEVLADPTKAGDQYDIEKSGVPSLRTEDTAAIRADLSTPDLDDEDLAETDEPENRQDDEQRADKADDDEDGGRNRKRRRRRRKKRDDSSGDRDDEAAASSADQSDESDGEGDQSQNADGENADGDEDRPRKRRRRGRRGGRRSSRQADASVTDSDAPEEATANENDADEPVEKVTEVAAAPEATPNDELVNEQEPAPAAVSQETNDQAPNITTDHENGAGSAMPLMTEAVETPAAKDEPVVEEAPATPKPRKPARKGWWQRAIGG